MDEITFTIQPDGSFLVPRGSAETNDSLLKLFQQIIESDQQKSLEGFFSLSDESELLFGSPGFCG